MTRAAILGILALTGCSRAPASPGDRSRLVASWTGSDTARIATHATAEWCDSLRVLEIRAIKGDTGIALAIFPVDSIKPDSYPAMLPLRADSLRSAAAIALRWFAETAIMGFQSESGGVVVEATDSQRVWGRFEARMRSVTEGSRLVVRGSFFDVPVVAAARGCMKRRPPDAPDSVVD
jgi:hypothetical protein